MILADLAGGTILVVMAHGTLLRTVLGLTIAFPVVAVEHGVAAVAVGAPTTLGVEWLAKLEFPMSLLVFVAAVLVWAISVVFAPLCRADSLGTFARQIRVGLAVIVSRAGFPLTQLAHANFILIAFLIIPKKKCVYRFNLLTK